MGDTSLMARALPCGASRTRGARVTSRADPDRPIRILAQATVDHVALGREFYQRLLIIAPDLRARFHGDIAIESAKLKDALKLAFGALSDLPFLVTTLEALAARGIARNLSDDTARAIAKSLLWAVERRIGAAFTPQA